MISAPNGEQREYVVTAVNSVGESRGAVRTTAWAYASPDKPRSGDFAPVDNGGEGGVADLTIRGIDAAETGTLEIASAAGQKRTISVGRNQETVSVAAFPVGSNSSTQITVTPISRFTVPPGLGGSQSGQALVFTAHGVGRPQQLNLTLTSQRDGGGKVTIVAEGSASKNGDGSDVRYGFAIDGSCRVGDDGPRRTFPGKDDGETYTVRMCVDSVYDGKSFGSDQTEKSIDATQDTTAPQGYTFRVGAKPVVDGDTRGGRSAASRRGRSRRATTVSSTTTGVPAATSTTATRTSACTSNTTSGRPAPTAASSSRHPKRPVPGAGDGPDRLLRRRQRAEARWKTSNGEARTSTDRSGVVYYDKSGQKLDASDPTVVPKGAVRVENAKLLVSWSAKGWGLDDATLVTGGTCDPGKADPSQPPAGNG